MKKLLVVLLITLLPSALVFAGSGDDLSYDDFVFHGVALPKARAALAPLRQGTVATIEVLEGARVEAGTLLASLDSRVAEAALAVARAAAERSGEIERATTQVELAEARLGRLQAARRREPRSVTDSQLGEAAGELRTARATLTVSEEDQLRARATLELEQARLEELRLRAPFDGLVTRIHTRPGESIAPGMPMLEIADLTTLVAEAYLPARFYGRLRVGQEIALDASVPVSRLVDAKLTWIDPVMDGATRCYRCVFEIDNTDLALPAGFTVEPVL